MIIAYVDTGTTGHSRVYLSELIKGSSNQCVAILTEHSDLIPCEQYIVEYKEGKKRSLLSYFTWLICVLKNIKRIKPDIIHFLSGDMFYRYFGFGLGLFRKYSTITTIHWIKDNRIGMMSTRSISRKVSRIIVHSAYLKERLLINGVPNATHVEYPQFIDNHVKREEACSFWGLNPAIKTLGCIGSTRYDKGLDILAKALESIKHPFQLLVAGQVNHFTEDQIKEMTSKYSNSVFLNIHYLSEVELMNAIAAVDYVVLPYRKVFNGASGPLGEGVAMDKCIIGANHGNLGSTIANNHLGYIFETENTDSLASILEKALSEDFVIDSSYREYQKQLDPDCFRQIYDEIYSQIT